MGNAAGLVHVHVTWLLYVLHWEVKNVLFGFPEIIGCAGTSSHDSATHAKGVWKIVWRYRMGWSCSVTCMRQAEQPLLATLLEDHRNGICSSRQLQDTDRLQY